MSDGGANADFRTAVVARWSSLSDQAPRAEHMKSRRGAVRSYVLVLKPNAGKAEEARYTLWWGQRLCDGYLKRLYAEKANAFVSTATLGLLANQQQKRARDILRSGRAAEKKTAQPFNCPKAPAIVDAAIRCGAGTLFPYWIKPPAGPWIPAQTHGALTRALKSGGKLRPTCELRRGKNGYVARVFVEHERTTPTPTRNILGCDVGVNAVIARSDGYIGPSLEPVMDRIRRKRAEQWRQKHYRTSARSVVKQVIDREAKRTVMLATRTGSHLAVESLKALSNLKPRGKIGAWARVHFGERVRQIAELSGVGVLEVWPSYTSQTCLRCGWSAPENRRGIEFRCTRCAAREHADVLGARNILRKATGVFRMERRHKGRDINTGVCSEHSLVGVTS